MSVNTVIIDGQCRRAQNVIETLMLNKYNILTLLPPFGLSSVFALSFVSFFGSFPFSVLYHLLWLSHEESVVEPPELNKHSMFFNFSISCHLKELQAQDAALLTSTSIFFFFTVASIISST